MAKVYRLRTMPAWDTWWTTASFFITSILLGYLAIMSILQIKWPFVSWGIIALLLLLELVLTISVKPKAKGLAYSLRVGLSIVTILGAGIMAIVPNLPGVWISPILFLLVLMEEVIGRDLFYKALEQRPF
jgi:DMSO reductase anchor subunit